MRRINTVERARFLEMIDQYANEAACEHIDNCAKNRCAGCLKENLVNTLRIYMTEIENLSDIAN